ncbi:MAG: hypothetical protein EPN34_12085 [Burkholderiaceae bacterium]|nr:MAG: hypothetical protein EPN34_12085 [Burkholderiaceae bacterium]
MLDEIPRCDAYWGERPGQRRPGALDGPTEPVLWSTTRAILGGLIMKKLALIAVVAATSLALSTGALAHDDGGGDGGGSGGSGSCTPCSFQGVYVGAPLNQAVSLSGSNVNATASGSSSYANNNIATNTFGVKIMAATNQVASISGSNVNATASGANSEAKNNLASNIGPVYVAAALNQAVSASGSNINATASGAWSQAVNNLATNNGCQTCSAPLPR